MFQFCNVGRDGRVGRSRCRPGLPWG